MTPLQRMRVRRAMVRGCRWGISNEGQIHYAPIRPIPFPACDHVPITTDCSGFAIWRAKCAGAPDPSGYGFNGAGNSTSIARHQRRIYNIRDLHRGDYVVFGRWDAHGNIIETTHVANVIDRSRFPWRRKAATTVLESHGQERGPLLITLLNELPYHPGETAQFYSLLHARTA